MVRGAEASLVAMAPEVVRVEVHQSQSLWRLHLKPGPTVSQGGLAALEERLLREVSGLKAVEWNTPTAFKGSLAQWVDSHWAETLAALFAQQAALRTYLTGARLEAAEDRLIIRFSSEAGYQGVRNKGLEARLSRYIQDNYGLSVQVRLELGELVDWSEHLEIQEKTERRLVEQRMETFRQESAAAVATSKGGGEAKGDKGPLILGRKINDQPMEIRELQDEERVAVIYGRVFGLEVRELKTGRKLITFYVTDLTDSIAVKVFEDEKQDLLGDGQLKDNIWVRCRGGVQYDKFTQELTLMARDINLAEHTIRPDEAEEKRVELHLHTKMSTMDGLAEVGDLIKRAAYWGHPAIAITDHGVVQAYPDAHAAAKKHGVKVIFGLEGYLTEEAPVQGQKYESYHIVILAKNKTGLKNLYKLITRSHLDHFHRRPRIPRALLMEHREGLLLGTACEAGELYRKLLRGASDEELAAVAADYDYLEIQPRGNNRFMIKKGLVADEKAILDINRRIVELGRKLNKPVAATGDVHFLEPDDAVYRGILMAGKGFEDALDQAPLYYQTTTEMLEEFAYLGSETAYEVVVTNPRAIADSCEGIQPIPKEFYPPKIDGAEDQIRQMSLAKAQELYGDTLPETVQKRLDKELNSIITNGFAVLYLIAHKLVKKSNDDGYLVGSRGSVGSSLVATMTGITEVNPLPPHYRCGSCKESIWIEDGSVNSGADLPDRVCACGQPMIKDGHDIPFETFLGFEGDKVPDIDLNFSGDYQPRAHKYTEELFGRGNVFRAGTIATVAEKTAFGYVKNYGEIRKTTLRSAEMSRLASGCTGVKRTTGQHPGGIMVVPQDVDIHDFTPLNRPADDTKSEIITTHFDYHSIHDNLVKLDILGHDDPTVIKMLEDLTGLDAKTIPLDEQKVLSIFSSPEVLGVTPEQINSQTGTYGIPEFGTKFVRQMLEDTKPKSFSDLVRISGFSHGTDVWLNNAQDLIKSGTCQVGEAISTRDDIMIYLIYKGLPPKRAFTIMEGVRKGKGLKPEDEELMKEYQVPPWYIESCKKIKYMFPKAHAVAYVTMAFRIAYFKVYYPTAFYAAFFTVRADEFDADLICQGAPRVRQAMEEIEGKGNEATQKEKNLYTILELALEMFERGIGFERVDLMRSDAKKFLIIDEQTLLPPLRGLQGVGETAALSIAEAARESTFTSVEDLRVRARISKTVIEAMENHGCLQGLDATDQLQLF